MKAAVVREIGVLEVWEIPLPPVGPYDVLCRMCFGSTCAGTDIHLTDGKHPFPVQYPTILGHESVGRVVEVGSKVRNFKVGDLVSRVGYPADVLGGLSSNWGGFAEYGIAKDHWQMQRDGVPQVEWDRNRVNQIIHPEIDERTAPMIITWRETLSYLKRIGVTSNTHLLLVGSGANALAFAAHACNMNTAVTVVGSPKREAIFSTLPIQQYIDYHSEDLKEAIYQSGHSEYDILLDAVGENRTVNQLLPLIKRDGILGVYGWNNRKNYGINPFYVTDNLRFYAGGYDEEETNSEVQAMILRGQLQASLWYDCAHPIPLEHIETAYQSLRKHEALKYLIQL